MPTLQHGKIDNKHRVKLPDNGLHRVLSGQIGKVINGQALTLRRLYDEKRFGINPSAP